MTLLEHFALLDSDRDDDRYGPWLPLAVVAPWRDSGAYYPPRIRRVTGEGFKVEAYIEGGEPGTVGLQMPTIIAPDHDWPRVFFVSVWMGRDEEAPARRIGPGLQVLAGGAIRVWPERTLHPYARDGEFGIDELGNVSGFIVPPDP